MPLNAQLRMGWISTLGVIRQATLSGLFILLVVINAGLTAFFWANVAMGVVLVAVTLLVLRGTAPLLPALPRGVVEADPQGDAALRARPRRSGSSTSASRWS